MKIFFIMLHIKIKTQRENPFNDVFVCDSSVNLVEWKPSTTKLGSGFFLAISKMYEHNSKLDLFITPNTFPIFIRKYSSWTHITYYCNGV